MVTISVRSRLVAGARHIREADAPSGRSGLYHSKCEGRDRVVAAEVVQAAELGAVAAD